MSAWVEIADLTEFQVEVNARRIATVDTLGEAHKLLAENPQFKNPSIVRVRVRKERLQAAMED